MNRMKKLFKKGQRVRHRNDGRVMEVLKYIKSQGKHLVECAWYDMESKEVRVIHFEEKRLRIEF